MALSLGLCNGDDVVKEWFLLLEGIFATISFFFSFLNRLSRRKRGMVSNPLFIIPDFFLNFSNELSSGYLRFEMGKFPKEFSHFLQT